MGSELTSIEELLSNQFNNAKNMSQTNHLAPLPQQDLANLHLLSNSFGLKDFSNMSPNHSDLYSCLNLDGSNSGSTVVHLQAMWTLMRAMLCQIARGSKRLHVYGPIPR